MKNERTRKLKRGVNIPVIGFGTWGLEEGKEVESIEYALDVGYRHIDTADIYDSHEAVAEAFGNSGLKRNEVFLTSKLWKDSLEPKGVESGVERFLDELDVSYLDLLLIHRRNDEVDLKKTLEAMQGEVEKGHVKSIGVSNFRREDIDDAISTGVKIVNNQIEQHPSLNESDLVSYCEEKQIKVTAYSPFARGDDLKIDEIVKLSEKYNKTTAQIIVNWLIAKGMITVPKSSDKDHIEDNLRALDWDMEYEDINIINNLNTNHRIEEK